MDRRGNIFWVTCRNLLFFVTVLFTVTGLLFSDAVYAKTDKTKSKSKNHFQQKRLKINPVTKSEDAWTANAETDVYRAGTYENLIIGYSAINGWDFSLTLINTQVLGSHKHFVGETFFNISKTFDINDSFSMVLGSQNGLALVNSHPQLWYDYTYLDNRYTIFPWLLIHGGVYFANAALTQTSRQIGFLTGTEIQLIQKCLSLQMDYISGHQNLSGATINLLLNITTRTQMYLGVSVPEQNSGNEFAGIAGFNFSTKDF